MTVTPAAEAPLSAGKTSSGSGELPFLRWAGGKRWLVPKVLELIGDSSVEAYHEPFLGGGSIFFGLRESAKAHLSDLNADLIEVYEQVKLYPLAVGEALSIFENSSDCYYEARSSNPADAVSRAARFIYLNHTSFNGIHRVNLKGEYNVPFGNRKSTRLPGTTELLTVSRRLQDVQLFAGDFRDALSKVSSGDFVFLDPPYTVAHNNNGFVKYNQHLFSFEDQVSLASEIERISALGAKFVLTNAAHESIDRLFSHLGRKIVVNRKNTVGGKLSNRGQAEEYMFTNIGQS